MQCVPAVDLVAGTAFLDQTFALHQLCRTERAPVREAEAVTAPSPSNKWPYGLPKLENSDGADAVERSD